jgi:periplasmic divalent cation tolerance protein
MRTIFIYITTSSEAEARKIAEAAVTDRLAACANIIPCMKSIYHWEGKIEEGDETILILKTRAGLFPAVGECVREMHSSETPCIVALPVEAGHAPYLDWIRAETKP